MATVDEAAGARNELAAGLAAGVEQISRQQEITFTLYVRTVLPLDGFVFWVRADLLSPSALLNAMQLNQVVLNQPQAELSASLTRTVKGSLHYTTTNQQNEDVGYATNRVVFTSLEDVEELNATNPYYLWLGTVDSIRFAFSTRGMFYKQANLYHYQGDAVYPAMETQIIDFPASIDLTNVVVSNSLPLWLGLNKFFPMFPSFLVPENIHPPWCAVHVDPNGTQALAAAPTIDRFDGSHYQLASDKVSLTMYGARNITAQDFMDYVFDASLNTDDFGIMNMPIIRDEKATQSELSIIAQKKTVEFEISYYQTRIRSLAMQQIKSAFITILPQ